MKKSLLLLALSLSLSLSFCTAYGQDKLLTLFGDTITCRVKEITEHNIKYSYEGEDLINNISQKVVEKIIFNSGRVQNFSERVIIRGQEDWEKVRVTTLESDIKGLVKGEEIMAKANSGWAFTNQGKIQNRAMDELKKLAAAKGYHMVLLITTTGDGHYGTVTRSSVTAVGYSYGAHNSSLPFNIGDKVYYKSGFNKANGVITGIEGDYYVIDIITNKGQKKTITTTSDWFEKIE